jgi:hypothetical protein
MAEALPFALLVFLVAILVAMPWRRPDPNHEFMLELLRLLEDEHTSPSDSSLAPPQSSTAGQMSSIPSQRRS